VFGTLGRRAIETVVGLFAVLGFAFVPLGRKTGLEHVVAVLHTSSAQEAVSGLISGVARAKARLSEMLLPGARDFQPLPLPSGTAKAERVRPQVPPLPR
jgi:hypothetical protein